MSTTSPTHQDSTHVPFQSGSGGPQVGLQVHGDDSPVGRELLGTYPSYADAQRVVDHLSDEKFPVQTTSIIGRDLVFVEQVTGRRTWGSVLLRGLGSGAMMGLFIGLLLGLFVVAPAGWLAIVLWATGFGAFFGVIFAAIGYAATGGSRDFDSVGQMTANRYDVYVESERLDEARTIMNRVAENV